jgi:uncharacterized protein
MKSSLCCRLGVFLVMATLTAVVGCAGSPPAKFYTLSPLLDTAEGKIEKGAPGRVVTVGVGPIRLPHYLTRKEIVTRTGEAPRIELAEYDLWGGSLQDDFSRTLMENLSLLLADDRVTISSWPGGSRGDYRVAVDVIRFDGCPGKEVVLVTKWVIREGRDNKELRVRNSRIRELLHEQGYDALVGGMSRAVGRLSREIGEDIKSLPR